MLADAESQPQIPLVDLSRDRVRFAELFHALSDPTRLAILDVLRNGERCVCDLTELLHAHQSSLSFHLKTLRDAGIVLDRREGRWIHYSMNPEVLAEMRDALAALAIADRKPSPSSCSRR